LFKALQTLLILGCLLISALSHAGTLSYRGGEIEYQSGYMDPETFNGEIRGVTFLLNTGETAFADYMKIRTTPLDNPDRLRVDTFRMSNFTFESTDGILAFSSVDLSGLELRGSSPDIGDLFSGDYIEDDILLIGDAELQGLYMDLPEEGVVSLNSLKLSTRQIEINVLETLPMQEGTIILDQLVLSPASASSDFAEELAELGLDQLVINARFDTNIDEKVDRVDTAMEGDITINGLGQIRLLLDIGFLNSTLQMLDAVLRSRELASNEQLGTLILSGGLFNKAEITLVDRGILPLAFSSYRNETGTGRDQVVAEIMDMLAMSTGLFAPRSYTLFAPEIKRFLLTGGSLRFLMRPSGPTPFSSFLGFAAAPDTAISLLGADIQHYP
jgi:hypothetical protein